MPMNISDRRLASPYANFETQNRNHPNLKPGPETAPHSSGRPTSKM